MDVIYQWFEKQVRDRPHATAIKHHDDMISYQMLMERAQILARQLRTHGVQPDTLVAVCLPRSSEQLIAILGILLAGGAYVPFDPAQQETRITRLLHLNQISLLVTTSVQAKRFERANVKICCVDTSFSAPIAPISCTVEPHHLAYLIHTSGSTGTPKGVLIEQHSVLDYCHWFQQYTHLPSGCVIDYSSNYIFDMAVTTALLPLLLGHTVVICDEEIRQSPRAYFEYLQANHIQLIKLTPSYLKILLQTLAKYPIELPDLSTIIVGGENLSTADCKTWLQHFPHHILFNEYGPSETTVGVLQHRVTVHNVNQYQPNIPIGQPGENFKTYLLDSSMQPVADGEMGELYLGGACLSRGYHHQPILTKEKFIDYILPTQQIQRLYKTGDLCRKNKEGVFEFLGRVDRQVKIRGYRIELGEIEHCLRQHPLIQDALIIHSSSLQQTLLAYCILHPAKAPPSHAEIRSYLLNFLPHYMLPSAFILLDKFPLTANGKLDEKALPLPTLSHPPAHFGNKLERQLVQIWAEELELDNIGIHDNFYALGGHSLHAARIVSTISKKMGKKLSLAEFYKTETISGLATILKRRQKKARSSKLSTAKHPAATPPHQRRRPLSDFQLLLWISKTFEPKANQLNLVSRKRLQGTLNQVALHQAFKATLKRHDIFHHRIATFYPAYLKQKGISIPLNETSLVELSLKDCELILLESLQDLTQLHPWPKKQPLAMLKIFYLPEEQIELQLCIPHLIADEISLNIFWRDLSHYYLTFHQQPSETHSKYLAGISPVKSFHDFIAQEQQNILTYLEQDRQFWDIYLKNSELISFSEAFIVRDMAAQRIPYSSYYALPSGLLHALQEYCIQHQVAIEDVLCVAVNATLKTMTSAPPSVGVINMVKSTRQDRTYDDTIGCFLRVDPIKIESLPDRSLLDLSKKVRQNILENAHFSQASTILKLAFIAAKNSQHKKTLALKYLIGIYQALLNRLQLDYHVLQFGAHFSSFKRDNRYIIYMNLWQNFLSSETQPEYLGLVHQPSPLLFQDLSSWDNLCDISFLRDEHLNQPYVVVSSNLLPNVRETMAKRICTTLEDMMTETAKHV